MRFRSLFSVGLSLAPIGAILIGAVSIAPGGLRAATVQAPPVAAPAALPTFDALLRHPVRLKPELVGVHPRVFVTKAEIEQLRTRAKTTHRDWWAGVRTKLAARRGPPPPAPGPQERRSQNNVAFAIAEVSLAYAVDQRPEDLAAARAWLLAAIDYEPWGYTYNKPNVDLAAGHLLYAIGWAYDLLYHDLTDAERARVRASLERHAGLVYDYFAPRAQSASAPSASPKRFAFTQNHDFIPTAGLAVTALALLGESADAPKWAALARAHHHRAGTLLSPDGYYYEGMEYWIFSAPWLVHFLDAWEHSTGESLWEQGPYKHWKSYVAHSLLPDTQNIFDFGDAWEGPLTRAGKGEEYARVFPGGTLQSNYNVLYRVATRFKDPETQAVAARLAAAGHSNLEEFWTLIWRDAALAPAPMSALPLHHHFQDSGVVFWRSGWDASATAFAAKAGPPEGHAAVARLAAVPEWEPSNGHAHPDVGSFILYARGRYLTGDTGYAGVPLARHHNTITIDGVGQGNEGKTHEVWDQVDLRRLATARVTRADLSAAGATIVLDSAGAYAASTGLTRFTRTLTVARDGAVHVADDVATEQPSTVRWYLHSDAPFTGSERSWRARQRGATLNVAVAGSTDLHVHSRATLLKAPGRPGSITQGRVDERGYELELESPAAREHRFDVKLTATP